MSQDDPRTAATYVRVSRDHQVGGESLDAQTAELLRFAEFKGLEVLQHLRFREEGVSGTKASRPALDQLLAAARRGEFQELVVWKVSRFGRSARHNLDLIHKLADLGIGVHFVNDSIDTSTPANRALLIPLLSGVAELESENIREQSMLGKLASAAKGKWQGGEPPFGTRAVDAPDGRGKVLAKDPHETKALRDVWRWLVEEGVSVRETAKRLNAMGVRTRRGLHWSGGNLRLILRNPRLAGNSTYAGIPVNTPEIFTEEEFIALTRVLEQASKRYGPKSNRQTYPLSGRIVCGCGGRWIGSSRQRRRYYRCQRNETDAPQRCDWTTARWIRADQIEDTVWAELAGVLSKPARLLAAADDYQKGQPPNTKAPDDTDLETLQKRIEELMQARRRLLLDHALRQISPSGIKDALVQIEADLEDAHQVYGDLRRVHEPDTSGDGWLTDVDSIAMRARRWLVAADPTQQRQIIDLLDIEIQLIDRNRYQITGSIPISDPTIYVKAGSPERG